MSERIPANNRKYQRVLALFARYPPWLSLVAFTKSLSITGKVSYVSTEVPGSLFGFSAQVSRMLVRLLQAQPGSMVSVEVLDDVATEHDEHVVAEQLKSSLSGNPVSDRAVDLWKTLGNWAEGITLGKFTPEVTSFELRTVQEKVPGKFASMMIAADTEERAYEALTEIRTQLWGEAPQFDLKEDLGAKVSKHLVRCFDTFWPNLPVVVARMSFSHGTGNPIDQVREELGRLIISEDFQDAATRHCLGWVKEQVDNSIASGAPAVVDEGSFRDELSAFVRKYGIDPLT